MKLKELLSAPWAQKLSGLLGQYKYVLLILGLGIVLLTLPDKQAQPTDRQPTPEPAQDLQQELESILRQVEGAGEVRVLLSWDTGTAYEYQTDVERKTDEGGTEETRTTVITSSGGEDSAVTVRTVYPTCKGAVVVCQGADSASVRLALVRAVSSITGLGSDRITVIKMKSGK